MDGIPEEPPTPGELASVSALVADPRGRILVVRRPFDRMLFPGCWDLPGEPVRDGESAAEALTRVVEDETGWRMVERGPLVQETVWTGEDGRTRRESAYLARVSDVPEQPRLETERHPEALWVDWDSLPVLAENRAERDTYLYTVVARALAIEHPIGVRWARLSDDRALALIDYATWSPRTSPAPLWPEDRPFFSEACRPEDVLVAYVDAAPAGYVKLVRHPLDSAAHVRQINGFAVDPEHQGRGIGRQLLRTAVDEARARGARRLTLRVLGSNRSALALYHSCGFVEEGRLRAEFYLDDEYVDDVFLAHPLDG